MAVVPSPPQPFVISSYTNVRVSGRAIANNNGNSTILQWQVGWGTNPNVIQHFGNLNLNGTGFIGELTPGTVYYFWNRQRNSIGWSPYSTRSQIRTRDRPDAPHYPTISARSQDSFTIKITPNWSGDAPITGYSLLYGKSPTFSGTTIGGGSSGIFPLDNLDPGKTYYFWGRAHNEYGASDWSTRSLSTLMAGAWVNVNNVWKRAVPYVFDGLGNPRMARTWINVNNKWIETDD